MRGNRRGRWSVAACRISLPSSPCSSPPGNSSGVGSRGVPPRAPRAQGGASSGVCPNCVRGPRPGHSWRGGSKGPVLASGARVAALSVESATTKVGGVLTVIVTTVVGSKGSPSAGRGNHPNTPRARSPGRGFYRSGSCGEGKMKKLPISLYRLVS